MKVKVNRLLSAGRYHINFEVSDFASEEIEKMGSFGVPGIRMQWRQPGGGITQGSIELNRINKNLDAVFNSENEAKDYEQDILTQIRDAIQRLRESQDKFSSSEEVAL